MQMQEREGASDTVLESDFMPLGESPAQPYASKSSHQQRGVGWGGVSGAGAAAGDDRQLCSMRCNAMQGGRQIRPDATASNGGSNSGSSRGSSSGTPHTSEAGPVLASHPLTRRICCTPPR